MLQKTEIACHKINLTWFKEKCKAFYKKSVRERAVIVNRGLNENGEDLCFQLGEASLQIMFCFLSLLQHNDNFGRQCCLELKRLFSLKCFRNTSSCSVWCRNYFFSCILLNVVCNWNTFQSMHRKIWFCLLLHCWAAHAVGCTKDMHFILHVTMRFNNMHIVVKYFYGNWLSRLWVDN